MPDVIPMFVFSFWQKVVMSLINDIILFLMNITVQTPPPKKKELEKSAVLLSILYCS